MGVSARRVVMVVPDLFFAARIMTAAAHLGVEIEPATPATLVDTCRACAPDLVIVDLHATGDPVLAIRSLRAAADLGGLRIVGFHSHVDVALRVAALEAGADEVQARSAFTVRLAGLLSGAQGP